MSMNEDALRFLHAIDDFRLPVIDPKMPLAALEAAQEANGEAWTFSMLDPERWVTHALGRLQASAEYQDRLSSRPLNELLGELADEAAALGAWGAIAQHALDAREDLEARGPGASRSGSPRRRLRRRRGMGASTHGLRALSPGRQPAVNTGPTIVDVILADDAALDALADVLSARLSRRLPRTADPQPSGWLDSAGAAAYLGISKNALHKHTAARTIPFEQDGPGCKCWFKRSALDAWRTGPAAKTQPSASKPNLHAAA